MPKKTKSAPKPDVTTRKTKKKAALPAAVAEVSAETTAPQQTAEAAPAAVPVSAKASKATAKPAAGKASSGRTSTAKALTGKAKVLDSTISFAGRIFNVTTETVTEPGGVTSTREFIRHNGSVVILAVDASRSSKNPMVLIERQYRHAAGQFLLELPAGRIEPGEKPLAAAKRELIEETGFRAKTWSKLVRYYASPGFLAEFMEVYLAEDIRAGEAQPEDDEKIELAQIPLRDLLGMIEEGKVLDGKTILSVLLYASRIGVKKAAKH